MSLKFAVVCASNQNRSMEAHNFMHKRGLSVKSFGCGKEVKLPGPSQDKPNVYSFDTPYDVMYKDLVEKDRYLYNQNGVLHMLERNRRIKRHPERFQESRERFDVIFTVEERIFDIVLEELDSRKRNPTEWVHIINIEISDNHDEATLGAFRLCELAELLEATEDLDTDIYDILKDYEGRCKTTVMHSIAFF
ncbi:hypothetical protein GJ496_002497 [Pomphorhynchus laevis]|nr:hypothetical protein GJ496_002497 [Pomphorhynchus laevis]